MHRLNRLPPLSLILLLLAGCVSDPVTVAPTPPPSYERLGVAEGRACGSIGFLFTAYNIVPIRLNSRVERAYQRALESVPGATSLVNVTYAEDWFWWVGGSAKCVTLSVFGSTIAMSWLSRELNCAAHTFPFWSKVIP